jgi:hypothetical protein
MVGGSDVCASRCAASVRFNLINPQTNNRIKMKTVDAGTGDEVSRSDLVKGFAIAKNQYVLLDKEDFESVKLESTRIIDIESFVPAASIDRLYWDTPYHLVPSGKTGIEAFARNSRGNGEEGHDSNRTAGHEHARADLRAGTGTRRNRANDAPNPRGGSRRGGGRPDRSAEG